MVNLKNTKAKLDEARFFLSQLQDYRSAAASGNPRKPDSQAFAYNLSAFISAARVVTWVLKAEEKKKYKAWLPGWEVRRQDWAKDHGIDDLKKYLLDRTNDMRLDVAKREGQVKTTPKTEMVPIARALWENNHYQINVALLGLTPEDAMLSKSTSSETHYIEGTDQEVVEFCEQYVSYLEALLLDFEREH